MSKVALQAASAHMSDPSEASHLLRRQGWPDGALKSIIILLVMKVCNNMFENQFASYDVSSFKQESNSSSTCSYVKQSPSSMLTTVVVAMATAAFLLPTLGGLLSDAFIGMIRVLWAGAILQLCGTALLVTLDSVNLTCHIPLYLISWVPVLLNLGLVDPILIYAPMRFTHDRRSRQLVLLLYFIAAAVGETFGNGPALLRYLNQKSYEYLGLLSSFSNLVCMTLLSLNSPVTHSSPISEFRVPRSTLLRKFYLITSGTIPHLTCISLCRVALYWQQVKFFTQASGNADLAASYVGLVGYQAATIFLSSCAAIAVFRRSMPEWVTLRFRIRAGLCLMILTKVILFLLSLLDYTNVAKLEGSSFMAVWWIYFVFAFCDGVTNVLTTVAIYELVYCIAEKSAKAMFLGVFYTVWGLAILLNGAILLILQYCGALKMDPAVVLVPAAKPQSHYAYGTTILLLVIAIAYWEKISWPLATGLLADHEAEEDEARADSLAAAMLE